MSASHLFIQVELLQNMMISRATGGEVQPSDYSEAREALVREGSIQNLLPSFTHTARSPDQFWGWIT